jgi:hypothetical protein
VNSAPDPRSELLRRFVAHLPLDTTDRVLVVLKGHLLVEELLRAYIEKHVRRPAALADARLTFHQCLCIARAFDNDPSREKLWLVIEKLNGLRNKFAHSLEPKDVERSVAEFITMQSNFDPSLAYADDGKKFGALASCLLGVCLTLSHAVHPL